MINHLFTPSDILQLHMLIQGGPFLWVSPWYAAKQVIQILKIQAAVSAVEQQASGSISGLAYLAFPGFQPSSGVQIMCLDALLLAPPPRPVMPRFWVCMIHPICLHMKWCVFVDLKASSSRCSFSKILLLVHTCMFPCCCLCVCMCVCARARACALLLANAATIIMSSIRVYSFIHPLHLDSFKWSHHHHKTRLSATNWRLQNQSRSFCFKQCLPRLTTVRSSKMHLMPREMK